MRSRATCLLYFVGKHASSFMDQDPLLVPQHWQCKKDHSRRFLFFRCCRTTVISREPPSLHNPLQMYTNCRLRDSFTVLYKRSQTTIFLEITKLQLLQPLSLQLEVSLCRCCRTTVVSRKPLSLHNPLQMDTNFRLRNSFTVLYKLSQTTTFPVIEVDVTYVNQYYGTEWFSEDHGECKSTAMCRCRNTI